MLSNALSMLVFWTRSHTNEPDAPVFYLHKSGQDLYQIIVQKVPKQEAIAA